MIIVILIVIINRWFGWGCEASATYDNEGSRSNNLSNLLVFDDENEVAFLRRQLEKNNKEK